MKHFYILLLLASSLVINGCSWYGKSIDEVDNEFLSLAYKSSSSFSGYSTFQIADSVKFVKDATSVRTLNDITQSIIDMVSDNMVALGYTKVSGGAAPDLIVDLAFIVSTTNSFFPGYYWDWGYWWSEPWYSNTEPWFTYYPYSTPINSSYSAGSLVIDIADITAVSNSTRVPIVWHGLVAKLLSRDYTNEERLAAITKCFEILPPK